MPITDDSIVEGSENFTVSLSGLAGTTANVDITDTGTVTITDNDTAAPPAILTVADVTVNENAGTAEVEVTLNAAVPGGFTVTAATADGTATAGEDYTATISRTLTFTGTLNGRQTLTVPITNDSAVEGEENFTVSLSAV